MYANSDCYLQADLDRHQETLNGLDIAEEFEISFCGNCGCGIDEEALFCDAYCQEAHFRHEELKKEKNG